MKRVLKILTTLLAVIVVLALAFVGIEVALFDHSLAKVYDVPPTGIVRSTDPAVIERGHHLAESVASCATSDCHGSDLTGGRVIDAGPLGRFVGPNITSGGRGAAYTDAELARLIQHGIKHDGRTVRFMPCQEIGWLPHDDLVAVVSWVRSVPPSPKPSGEVEIGVLGKVLDRLGMGVHLDVARGIDHEHLPDAPAAEPTVRYGAYLARSCTGCHGERLGGGPIPGAPPSMPVPLNLTPHQTGLKGWSYADFERVLDTRTRPDGRKLNPFMPFEAFGKFNQTERQALWAYLQSLPPRPMGSR